MNTIKVLRVFKNPIFDVFLGDGWNNWSRVLIRKDKMIHLDGNRFTFKSKEFSDFVLKQIKEYLKHEPELIAAKKKLGKIIPEKSN